MAVQGTAPLPLAWVAAIHVPAPPETWMPGTSPGMTRR